MSIRVEWKGHLVTRRLFKLDFRFPGPAEKRLVLMTPEITRLVLPPWEDTLMGDRCARLRADLESFLDGSQMNVCWTPFRGRPYHRLGRLDPVAHGIWDVRSVDPTPALRVFFCLAEKDVMIALGCSPRSVPVTWLERPPLGPKESERWRRAIRECQNMWDDLFPSYRPHVGGTLDECISNAISI
jgi:hypothetical protein